MYENDFKEHIFKYELIDEQLTIELLDMLHKNHATFIKIVMVWLK